MDRDFKRHLPLTSGDPRQINIYTHTTLCPRHISAFHQRNPRAARTAQPSHGYAPTPLPPPNSGGREWERGLPAAPRSRQYASILIGVDRH